MKKLETQHATGRLPFRGVRTPAAMGPIEAARAAETLRQNPELITEARRADLESQELKDFRQAANEIKLFREAAQIVRDDPKLSGDEKQREIRNAERGATAAAENLLRAYPLPPGSVHFLPFISSKPRAAASR